MKSGILLLANISGYTYTSYIAQAVSSLWKRARNFPNSSESKNDHLEFWNSGINEQYDDLRARQVE